MRTAKSSRATPDEVSLGHISGVFGVRGEVRLFLHNRASAVLNQPTEVILISPEGERFIVGIRARSGAGERVLARLDGVEDREHARELMGWEVVIPRAALPPTQEGEYYHSQLIGLEVVTASGHPLGRLTEIHDTGPVHVWVSRSRGETHFIPALKENVVEVDLDAGVIRVSDACASTF
ncbi:MAG: 16S rRNA processing protein RimM [Alphaproteobacteria bacterium]|nr:16S rRNA processing protein RimM [Alphaproteobacteria bacterium]